MFKKSITRYDREYGIKLVKKYDTSMVFTRVFGVRALISSKIVSVVVKQKPQTRMINVFCKYSDVDIDSKIQEIDVPEFCFVINYAVLDSKQVFIENSFMLDVNEGIKGVFGAIPFYGTLTDDTICLQGGLSSCFLPVDNAEDVNDVVKKYISFFWESAFHVSILCFRENYINFNKDSFYAFLSGEENYFIPRSINRFLFTNSYGILCATNLVVKHSQNRRWYLHQW